MATFKGIKPPTEGFITYEYVEKLLKINKGVENLEDHAIKFLINQRFFSMENFDIFKSIVPSLISCSDFTTVSKHIYNEIYGYYSYPYKHEIMKYLIEEIFSDFDPEKIKHPIVNSVITLEILDYYLERGLQLKATDYCVISSMNSKQQDLQLFCLRRALEICVETKNIDYGNLIIG
jgi:hypothetical protein